MFRRKRDTRLEDILASVRDVQHRLAKLEGVADAEPNLRIHKLELASTHLHRNTLPNDSAALQKALMALWRQGAQQRLAHAELADSGFRVFSQNDEDGILLRLLTQLGASNRQVIEIGSNCAGSAIGLPENLSTNLIVNHGWHGHIIEMDPVQCEHMRYYFAREHATRHFHWRRGEVDGYYSPRILAQAVTPENINALLASAGVDPEPDVFVLDIDSADYPVLQSLELLRPRILVVEFEKRFRDRHAVVQFEPNAFSKRWQQSGTCSLPAWEKLLRPRGYGLCAIGAAGFNAFYARNDVAAEKVTQITAAEAFASHPVFAHMEDSFWLEPDETWREV